MTQTQSTHRRVVISGVVMMADIVRDLEEMAQSSLNLAYGQE